MTREWLVSEPWREKWRQWTGRGGRQAASPADTPPHLPDPPVAATGGEKSVDSKVIAGFPDLNLIRSSNQRTARNTTQDWKKFRTAPAEQGGSGSMQVPLQPGQGDIACTHVYSHSQVLTHVYTLKGLRTIRGTALYSLQRAFSFIISLDTEGQRNGPWIGQGFIPELARHGHPQYPQESRAHPIGCAAQLSPGVASGELNGNINARKAYTQLPRMYAFALLRWPFANHTRTQGLDLLSGHLRSSWGDRAKSPPLASSVESLRPLFLVSPHHRLLGARPPPCPKGCSSAHHTYGAIVAAPIVSTEAQREKLTQTWASAAPCPARTLPRAHRGPARTPRLRLLCPPPPPRAAQAAAPGQGRAEDPPRPPHFLSSLR